MSPKISRPIPRRQRRAMTEDESEATMARVPLGAKAETSPIRPSRRLPRPREETTATAAMAATAVTTVAAAIVVTAAMAAAVEATAAMAVAAAMVVTAAMAAVAAVTDDEKELAMKQLIEGLQLAQTPPKAFHTTGISPEVQMKHGMILDDGNMWSSPTLIIGAVGSGKSYLLRQFMHPIMEYAASAGDAVVVFCAKPELLAQARPGDLVISVSATAPENCWSIFAEMEASDDPERTLREISLSLFHEAEERTNQPFFPQAAQDMFFQSAMFLFDQARKRGRRCDNADLLEFLIQTPIYGDEDSDELGWLNYYAKAYPERFGMLRDYLGGDGNAQGMGVLSEIRVFLARTMTGSFARAGGRFSAHRAIREGKRVFLHYDYARAGRSSLVIMKTILDLLLKEGMSSKAAHKSWFFLDEYALLPKSDVMIDSLLLGRDPSSSGKGGVRIIAALQSAQLMSHHYKSEEAKSLLSLFPNVIAMRISDPISRAVLSERYGKARYQYIYAGAGGRSQSVDALEDVVSDYDYAKITEKGQAILSLPGVSNAPFIYNGYEKGTQP